MKALWYSALLVPVALTAVAASACAGVVHGRGAAPLGHGFVAGHLFLSGTQLQAFTSGANETLVRYPIVNGKPASAPDLVYPTSPNVVGPVTVDSVGNVYAAVDCMMVEVFAPNQTTPTRTLNIGLPCGGSSSGYGVITALQVDVAGYLYVSLDNVSAKLEEAARRPKGSTGPLTQCEASNDVCTLVYQPGAAGSTAPIGIINAGDYSLGSALDDHGRLFLESTTTDTGANDIEVWTHEESMVPILQRTISGSDFSAVSGIAIDYWQSLFVNNAVLSGSGSPTSSYVAVYHANATGNATPIRSFQTSPSQIFWNGLAVDSSAIYTGTGSTSGGSTPTIELFRKNASGNATPSVTQVISVPADPAYVALGP